MAHSSSKPVHSTLAAVDDVAGRVIARALRGYQWAVSPMLGRNCRFEPSCSHFAADAVRRHGVVRGGWMATRRVLRCHPWGGPGGFDPVPD